LEREQACEIRNVLLLELKKNIEKRKKTLLFSLYFLLMIKVKKQIVFIAFIRVEISG